MVIHWAEQEENHKAPRVRVYQGNNAWSNCSCHGVLGVETMTGVAEARSISFTHHQTETDTNRHMKRATDSELSLGILNKKDDIPWQNGRPKMEMGGASVATCC